MIKKKAKAVPQALQKAGEPLEVSQSTIKTWRRCRAKYNYRYVQLIERKRPVLQLIRGTMIGKCLDAIALHRVDPKSPKWQLALEPYRKQYAKLFAAEQEHYGDPIAEVERIISRYEQVYAGDGFTYQKGPDGSPCELSVKVDLLPGVVFTGSIDKMPRDKQGRIWDMDHKSHKNIPDAENRFADIQQVLYMWAAPLSGYPKLSGVIWDYLRTKPPAIPEQLKNGELTRRKNIDTDYDTYLAEVTRLKLNPKDYLEILTPLKSRGSMDFFQRVQLPNPPAVLINNIVADLKSTAAEIHKLGGSDKTRSLAFDCNRCEYNLVCQSDIRGLDSSFIRKTDYQINQDPRHVHNLKENQDGNQEDE